jgi:folylpolyglutamate synthase/dihydrofolate synthase
VSRQNKISRVEQILGNLINHEISLHNFSPEKADAVFQIDRFRNLLNNLGNPQKFFPSIQVAGTNGKGSVVFFLESFFLALGREVGAFYSPHLEKVHERIKINGRIISDTKLAFFLQALEGNGKFTFFEALTGAAFLAFKEIQANPAILETGLGGRLDSVTCARAKVGIITSIALDHQHILGRSKIRILREKAAISHKDMDLVIGPIGSFLEKNLLQFLADKKRNIYFSGQDFFFENISSMNKSSQKPEVQTWFHFPAIIQKPIRIHKIPEAQFMQQNLLIALGAFCVYLSREREDNSINYAKLEKNLQKVISEIFNKKDPKKNPFYSGRLEILGKADMEDRRGSLQIEFLFDGCHNPHGAQNLAHYLNSKKEFQKILFFTAYQDKNIRQMLLSLSREVQGVVLWRPPMENQTLKSWQSFFKDRWFCPEKFLSELLKFGKKEKRFSFAERVSLMNHPDNFPQSLTIEIQKVLDGQDQNHPTLWSKAKPLRLLIIFCGSLSSYALVKGMVKTAMKGLKKELSP